MDTTQCRLRYTGTPFKELHISVGDYMYLLGRVAPTLDKGSERAGTNPRVFGVDEIHLPPVSTPTHQLHQV
jgi:hypothetical protein